MNVSTYVVLRDGVVLASEENPVLAFRKCLECLFDFVDLHQQAFGPYGLPFAIEAQINAWSTDVENDYPDSEIASWHRALVLFLLLREKDPLSIDRNASLFLKKGFVVSDKEEGFVFDFNIDRAASLLLKYAENSEGSGKVEKMKIASLIVRHLPIYMNGDMDHPISKEVFYQLAQFDDTSGEPLSKKIADTQRTTRILDDETIAEMLNDPKVHDIIKKVFAHSKFQKAKTRTPPPLPDDDFIKRETDEGRKIGYEKGIADSGKYVDYDDKDIQDAFGKNIQEYLTQCCPKDYYEIREKCFKNGFCRGYERGVNAPIRKLNCGKEDGIQFVARVKERFGKDIVYVERTRRDIGNFVRHHLNDIQNIPEQYRHSLYRRWYCDSFQRALRSPLRPKVRLEEGESIEDADNVLRHILSRLFEFLYISVYRETTFREIFKNADPKVFLEAVGISKEDFEALNKYKIFEERTLDNYIKEFFVNEELGKNSMAMSGEEKGKYRNSFDWFGYGIKDER